MPAYGDVAEGLDYLASLGFTHFSRIEPDGSLVRKNRAEMIDRLGMGPHEVCDVVDLTFISAVGAGCCASDSWRSFLGIPTDAVFIASPRGSET